MVLTMPVRCFAKMRSPYLGDDNGPQKHRFYVNAKDLPSELLDWMSTNPREQNLNTPVAKAISASLLEDNREFHLRNRGILLSAKTVTFKSDPLYSDLHGGTVSITLEDPSLHGNIDGGHTLKLLLRDANEANAPDQYVEFEVITGLETAIGVAEARNTSVALDMRTLEEMKGSYAVLKEVFDGVSIGADPFFSRVEMKMNQQSDEHNKIDIRMIISILLMFNVDLYPNSHAIGSDTLPLQMYGGKEAALKKYLALGNGDQAERDSALRKMAPIMVDVIRLYDKIERELPLAKERSYRHFTFATSRKSVLSLFSNEPLKYYTPQSVIFPVLAAFRMLIQVTEDGSYTWAADPISAWEDLKDGLTQIVLRELKSARGNHNVIVKRKSFWRCLQGTIELNRLEKEHAELNRRD